MKFESLGLSAPIVRALHACAYRQPTPIQEQAIPPALAGRDVLGCAQTGTGKTCAFGTPILQRLAATHQKSGGIRALILTPTRELALQIQESFEDYGKGLPLKSTVIFGGVGQAPQVEQLRRGVDILTATPGRLLDLHSQKLLDLSKVEIFVLDEADRMLDMGFIHDVKKIVALIPKKRQTLFFSATMPQEVMELVDSLLSNPVHVAVNPVSSPVEIIRQEVYLIDRKNKTALLAQILRSEEENVKNALVFTRTKHGADKVTRELVREGITAAAIHGNKSQTARQSALYSFKDGKIQVLVATDIAARGLDIEELSHVFNYNLPEVPETYIHRIGRTGRAGHGGVAISFCDYSEMPFLRGIEALLGRAVPLIEGHEFPMEVFETLKRDAKGRIVNADDEEARQAARTRRQEKGAQKPQATGAPKEAAKPQAKVPPKAQQKAQQKPQPQPNVKAQAAEKPAARPYQKPVLQEREGAIHLAHPAEDPRPSQRPDPLGGEVIMDATARLFATKKLPPNLVSRGQSASKQPNAPQKAEAPKHQGGEGQKRNDNRRGASKGGHREPQGTAAAIVNAQAEKKGSPAPQEGGRKKGRDQGSNTLRGETRNRGGHRKTPTVEGLRSRQKDSTEQPSLMKPFYIDHD